MPRPKRSASVKKDDAVKVVPPAAKRAKKASVSADLSGAVFCITGKMSIGRAALTKLIVGRGGSVAGSVTGKVTHVLSTIEEVAGNTAKIVAANAKGLPIVSEDYLEACEQQGKLADAANFGVGSAKATSPPSPPAKKAKKVVKKEAPAKAKKTMAKKEPIVKTEVKKEQVKKSHGVPRVNEHFKAFSGAVVAQDDINGGYYDAMLNQTDIKSNANKFYVCQLLQNPSGTQFATYTRWGRVGDEKCQDQLTLGQKALCVAQFEKKFRDKTKNAWNDKQNFVAKAGKYTLIELDYTNDDESDDDVDMNSSSEKQAMPDSELDKRLQQFMSLLFDINMMEKALTELNFDVKKMPLGKLSKEMVIKGSEILLGLENEINKKSSSNSKLQDLSSQFYTLIPHAFSRSQVPPTLNKIEDVRNKMRLLDTIHDIEAASKLMKNAEKECKVANEKHIVDMRYEGMNCEIEPLDKKEKEFKMCEDYLKSSWEGVAHPQVENIFRINRHGEEARFNKAAKKIGNRQLLWHGSPLANFGGILSQGLRIAPPEAPCSGYRFGKGIYLADMPSLSWRYCRAYGGTPSCLILCDSAIGRPAELPRDEFMTKPKNGSDSTHALGRIGPDPAGMKETEYGFKVPAGKLKQTTNNNVSCHEAQIVVYDVAQVQIKYVLQLKPFKR